MNRLPFFLPMKNCPNLCVYCDQRTITGHSETPSPSDVRAGASGIEGEVEVCFFGGSFTCFPKSLQREYLAAASSATGGSRIRVSTHPSCITREILSLLGEYPVSIVELGISSLDDSVLNICNRGYSGKEALEKISLLLDDGRFTPGVQMMTGLPGQTESSSLEDLRLIAAVKGNRPMQLRIYPCLVLKGTRLEEMLTSGDYKPPGIADSSRWAGRMIDYANAAGFELLRVGLQETASLGEGAIAGPHHPALGEFARAFALALSLVRSRPSGPWTLPPLQKSLVFGHGGWGLGELARLTGKDKEETESLIYWSE
ncbi:MAG: radical SAM protein [Thermovirgaceae bacterium]|nr:radical SAM protein [Thermovirgaceae bacterium]